MFRPATLILITTLYVGVLVAIARLLVDGAAGDGGAGTVDIDVLRTRAQLLVVRAESVDPAEVPALEADARTIQLNPGRPA